MLQIKTRGSQVEQDTIQRLEMIRIFLKCLYRNPKKRALIICMVYIPKHTQEDLDRLDPQVDLIFLCAALFPLIVE